MVTKEGEIIKSGSTKLTARYGELSMHIDDEGKAKFVSSDAPLPTSLVSSDTGNPVNIQNPLPTDGDSVYCKDVWVDESIVTDWVDTDSSGNSIACIPFNNLHTRISNSTTDNPKILRIHFNRTVNAHQIGLGCTGGGNYSNVSIKLLGSGGVTRTAVDDSNNNTKYTSRNYPFEPQLFNAIEFEFHTTDAVCFSNITIQKSTNVGAQIQGLRADGTIGTVNVTNGNNLKMSLEELESGISEDDNTTLRVAPIIADEYGNSNRQLGDNGFKGAVIAIPPEHHEIHCGDSYTAHHVQDLGNGATHEYLIITHDWGDPVNGDDPFGNQAIKVAHFVGQLSGELETEFWFYEAATVSDNGNVLNVLNRNRNSSNTDYLSIYEGATITAVGTELEHGQFGSGRGTGGDVNRTDEWILKNNTIYLLRVTNKTTNANYHTMRFQYYVHPGV